MRGELPAGDLDLKNAYDRLKEHLEMRSVAVEPRLEEPELWETPTLHDAPTWLNRSIDGTLFIFGNPCS
jgi:hypothetical protein